LRAIQKSEEYAVKKSAETGQDIPADERLTAFIEALGKEAEVIRKDADGND